MPFRSRAIGYARNSNNNNIGKDESQNCKPIPHSQLLICSIVLPLLLDAGNNGGIPKQLLKKPAPQSHNSPAQWYSVAACGGLAGIQWILFWFRKYVALRLVFLPPNRSSDLAKRSFKLGKRLLLQDCGRTGLDGGLGGTCVCMGVGGWRTFSKLSLWAGAEKYGQSCSPHAAAGENTLELWLVGTYFLCILFRCNEAKFSAMLWSLISEVETFVSTWFKLWRGDWNVRKSLVADVHKWRKRLVLTSSKCSLIVGAIPWQ